MFFRFYVILVCLTFSLKGFAHPFQQPSSWKNPEISRVLKERKVLHIKPMKEFLKDRGRKADFAGEVFLVTLEGGVKAVFKPQPLDDLGDAYAEVAAYKASLFFGFPYIPPTVIRSISSRTGSLQLYVESSRDLLREGVYKRALTEIPQEELEQLKIFYFVFGQWDSGPHNLLFYEKGEEKHLIAIDNAGIRNRQYVQYGELPFVRVLYSDALKTDDWGEAFPFHKARTIHPPTLENLQKIFGRRVPQSFYKNFKSYGSSLHYVLYQNSVWRQYHAADKEFVRSYAPTCSFATRQSLEKLTLSILEELFREAKGSDFLTKPYLASFLDRRDQVLKMCRLKKTE